ncbi:MAG: ABC transporter substrate-binding protein [Deltaproteobacteria bacterium]|nr:ABC transporter substrate-binding protein [Deltaproteobacteria bacterium]
MPCPADLSIVGPVCRRVAGVLLALLILIAGCKQREEQASPGHQATPLAVTICHGSVADILPHIALERGYFSEEGLTVTLKDLSNGKLAFDGLLQGECNFAVSGAPPIVLADPQSPPFAILATVLADDDSTRIIGRRDRGIAKPRDIKGKRIGVKKEVTSHFFLDLFMMKHGLGQNEVIRVFMEPDAFQAALSNGEIDGFSMTNRMVNDAAETLGDQGVVFAEPGLILLHGILTTRPDIPFNLQVAPKVLKALVRAEQYAKSEPAAAKDLLGRTSKLPLREIEEIWGWATIEVALANTLFVHLEDQYRWQVERGGTPGPAVMPNYLNLVLPGYLQAIKPGAVSIIKPTAGGPR